MSTTPALPPKSGIFGRALHRLPPPWKRALLYGLVGFVCLRLFVTALGLVAHLAFPMPPLPLSSRYMHGFVPTPDELSSPLAEIWLRWDATWYLSIAQSGYRAGDGSVAFFPLYPLLTSGLGRLLGGRYLWAGLVLSNLAAAALLVLFCRLAEEERGPAVGRPALEVLVTFPTAFFLLMPYTESLFLLLAVAAFLCWRRGHWLGVGLVGALAALTRPHGVLLFPAFLLGWLLALCRRRHAARSGAAGPGRDDSGVALPPAAEARRHWGALLSLSLIPGATLSFAGYASFFVEHAPFWAAQEWGWAQHWTWPWLAVWEGFRNFSAVGPAVLFSLLSIGLVVLPLLAGIRQLAPPYWAYSFMVILLSMSKVDAEGVIVSMHRFVLMVFPAFILLGEIISRRRFTWFVWRWLGLTVQALAVVAFARWGGVW